jgi:hypothetical protein
MQIMNFLFMNTLSYLDHAELHEKQQLPICSKVSCFVWNYKIDLKFM